MTIPTKIFIWLKFLFQPKYRLPKGLEIALKFLAGHDHTLAETALQALKGGLLVAQSGESDFQIVLVQDDEEIVVTLHNSKELAESIWPAFKRSGKSLVFFAPTRNLHWEVGQVAGRFNRWDAWAYEQLLWAGVLIGLCQDEGQQVFTRESGELTVLKFWSEGNDEKR